MNTMMIVIGYLTIALSIGALLSWYEASQDTSTRSFWQVFGAVFFANSLGTLGVAVLFSLAILGIVSVCMALAGQSWL